MTSWLHTVAEKAAQFGAVVRVSIARTDGSVPREAGAAMIVTAGGIEGTIGGGALELDAIATARAILSNVSIDEPADWHRDTRDYPLGPSLGQCCGGYAKVLFEVFTREKAAALLEAIRSGEGSSIVARAIESGAAPTVLNHRKDGYSDLPLHIIRITREMLSGAKALSAVFIPASKRSSAWFIEPVEQAKTPLFLYGAGHVGRALIRILIDLPFKVTWIDTSADRFPASMVEGPTLACCVAKDPAAIAMTAPDGAFHLVMTYSHPLDLAICHAALTHGNSGFLGLIGSRTKRARFLKRLGELGHGERTLEHLTCPIGVSGVIGKEPAIIAISVAAQLLQIAGARSKAANVPQASGAAQ